MDTIGKFRTNFLGKGRSFKIGFNNRSPFSYISSTGPAVPATYDGGVALVNFSPDHYAKAFDTSDAVRAETEMYKKAGEAAGKVVSAVGGAVAGAAKAGKASKAANTTGPAGLNTGKASFKDILKGAKDGFTKGKGIISEDAKKRVDAAMDSSTSNVDKKENPDNEMYQNYFNMMYEKYKNQ